MANDHTTVSIPNETHKVAVAYCSKRGLKLNWVVKQALEKYMQANQK